MSSTLPLSFEFFPPKTDKGRTNLKKTRDALIAVDPQFFSVTYGAGGSTQDNTLSAVADIQMHDGVDAAPHLSCVGSDKQQLSDILDGYKQMGIKRIVALRGDLPSGMMKFGEFHYAADLVTFIRQQYGDFFTIEVAAYPEMHPQADSYSADLQFLADKMNAGADSAITQYFYNADAYFRFVDDCQAVGIDKPIVPGIMPITHYANLARFSSACGAEIPRWLRIRLEKMDDEADVAKLSHEFVSKMTQQLHEGGAPALHFYTMNKADASLDICRSAGLLG